jgi:hypothetical protein
VECANGTSVYSVDCFLMVGKTYVFDDLFIDSSISVEIISVENVTTAAVIIANTIEIRGTIHGQETGGVPKGIGYFDGTYSPGNYISIWEHF